MIARPLTHAGALHVVAHVRADDLAEVLATRWSDDRLDLAESFLRAGPYAWECGLTEAEPIACVGALEIWPGVWQAWMVATDAFDKIGFQLTRFVRRTIMPIVTTAGAHRVQAHSAETHAVAHRWLESLGAKYEAPVPAFGRNGEDFRCYAWTAPKCAG